MPKPTLSAAKPQVSLSLDTIKALPPVEKISQTVVSLRMDVSGKKWEQWFLLRADAHHDNKFCDHVLERKHLKQAVDRNALILDFGDLFCAMQGKWDKRADDKQLRPELVGEDYLDRLVEYNAKFYGPFARNFALVGQGNHETSILKRTGSNLTERLVERLKMTNRKICAGGFSGWVRFAFDPPHHKASTSKFLKWHHGYGGDAPVTKGVIQTNRMAVYLPDADFVVTGHTHNEWIFPITRERINKAGNLYKDKQVHIKVPGYKDEYDDGYGGWHIERGGPPKPLGAAWLRFFLESTHATQRVAHEVLPAD